jgi:hypothetical protein
MKNISINQTGIINFVKANKSEALKLEVSHFQPFFKGIVCFDDVTIGLTG